MESKASDTELKWFAARAIRERSYVLRYLECQGVQLSRISDLPTMLFLHCTQQTVRDLRYALYDRVLFYKDPERQEVQEIPERTMRTFLLLEPFHDQPVIYLPVDDPAIFEGPRMVVTEGVFRGCEGVLKRIKGEKRLLIKISDHAAIATPHIPARMLREQ